MRLPDWPLAAARVACRIGGPLVLALALAASLISAVLAHEGHDHGPPPPPLPVTVQPRVVAESESYQLVGIARGAELTIFLDRYGTNEPVTNATISILSGAETIATAPRPDGSYAARIPALARPGRHELVFGIASKDGDDLLAGAIELAAPVAAAAQAARGGGGGSAQFMPPGAIQYWMIGSALVVGLGLGFLIGRRRRCVAAIAVALACAMVLRTEPAAAHEGHELSPVPEGASLSGDIPRRLADGSVFLPKPSQRLLTIRSQIAAEGQANRGMSLVGRVIADPNRAGVVQSIAGGRVVPPEGGLPRLGQAVKQGDGLATVIPALPLADQSTLAEKQRELEGAVLLARQKLARATRLANVTPRSTIEDTELEISNLEQRLASLKGTKLSPEVLTAPIDGIVSTSKVVAGQVVAAQDVLFQIVDTGSLWVEALLFDTLDPGAIVEASALTSDGTALRLAYRGRGRALQAQAVQVHFAVIEPPARVAIGQPVTVIARKAEPVRGMLLPRDAVVRGPAGEAIVWHQIEPERFVARQVRTEPFDGEQVLVTGGIAARDRIVVHGAELIAQVR